MKSLYKVWFGLVFLWFVFSYDYQNKSMLKTAKEATDHNNDTVIMGVFYGHAHILNIIVIYVNNNINQYNYLFYL